MIFYSKEAKELYDAMCKSVDADEIDALQEPDAAEEFFREKLAKFDDVDAFDDCIDNFENAVTNFTIQARAQIAAARRAGAAEGEKK